MATLILFSIIVIPPMLKPTPTIQIIGTQGINRWRCEFNITIKNNAETKIHIPWVYMNVTGITYIDGSFEELGITGNFTVSYEIEAGQTLSMGPFTATELGFDNEPKTLYVRIEIYILEAKESAIETISINPT